MSPGGQRKPFVLRKPTRWEKALSKSLHLPMKGLTLRVSPGKKGTYRQYIFEGHITEEEAKKLQELNGRKIWEYGFYNFRQITTKTGRKVTFWECHLIPMV